MIKLIATDMDGTFLNNEKKFDPEFLNVFYQLKQKGIKFCIASGNQYLRLYRQMIPLSEEIFFIAENGGFIAYGSKCLNIFKINPTSVKNILNNLATFKNLMIVVCGRYGAYILKKFIPYQYEIVKYYFSFEYIDNYDEINDEIVKIAIYDPNSNISDYLDQVKSILPEDVKVVTSGHQWMDITRKDVNKGIGISMLQEKMSISKDNCAAFGDNMNDFELLTSVKYSYAMENAVQAIKDIAYEVIGSNEEQAVITKMKEILQEEK